MIDVGIVSVQKKKGFITGARARKIDVKDSLGDEIVVLPIEVRTVLSASSFFGRYILRKRISTAESILKEKGARLILHTRSCKAVCNEVSDAENNEFGIPMPELLNCFEMYMKKAGGKTQKRLVVSDRYLRCANIEFLSSLCLYAKEIVLKTEELKKAEEIADMIFYDFGIWIEAEKYEGNIKLVPGEVVIDADGKVIKAGDLVLDGVDYGLEFGCYDINAAEAAERIKKYKTLKIKNIKSGNNGKL